MKNDNPTKAQMGIITSHLADAKVSQARWDVMFHEETDCSAAKRPEGCLVCNHDTESCTIENCALCQKKKRLPFDPNVKYVYPEN